MKTLTKVFHFILRVVSLCGVLSGLLLTLSESMDGSVTVWNFVGFGMLVVFGFIFNATLTPEEKAEEV